MTDDERLEIVETALAAEYPEIWRWEPTEIPEPYGPDDRGKVQDFAKSVAKMRQDCIDALLGLPEDELRKMQGFRRRAEQISIWPWSAALPQSPSAYTRQIPPHIAYGFGHPFFAPDFSYWALMPELSLMEATLLSVGADPKHQTSDDIYRLKKVAPEKLWVALRFLIERYDLLLRVFPSGPTGKMHMKTGRLYGWLLHSGLDIHPGFLAALRQRFDEQGLKNVRKEPNEVEKRSLLRLVAGMAIKGYRYDPRNQRNEAVQEISDDLDRLGISLDLKTIRKWLKEFSKLIDEKDLDK